jgi:uncharacterized membrane protein YfhO
MWPGASSGDAIAIADAASSSAVATFSETGGTLVLARLFYPGWRARIDGVEVPIVRVNGALMGVLVPPGAHWVEVGYRPASVANGLAISVAGLVALGALALPRRRRARFEAAQGRR